MDAVSCVSSSVWRWSSYAEVSFQRHPEAARATDTQQTWRQEFLGSRSSTVERSSTRTAAAGTFLRFFQTIFENTSLWRLKHLVTLSTYRRYINKYIYLPIYLYPLMNSAPTSYVIHLYSPASGKKKFINTKKYTTNKSRKAKVEINNMRLHNGN